MHQEGGPSSRPIASQASSLFTLKDSDRAPALSAHQSAITPQSSMSQASEMEQSLQGAEIQAHSPADMDSGTPIPVVGSELGIDAASPMSMIASENSRLAQSPASELEKTIIRLRYGDECKEMYTVHLSVLLRRSVSLQSRFTNADKQRLEYENVNEIRKNLKSLLYPETSPTTFSDKAVVMVTKAIHLIMTCYGSYDLFEYRVSLKKQIEDYIAKTMKDKKYLRGPPSAEGLKSKDRVETETIDRLHLLNPNGVRKVSIDLYKFLWFIKQKERAQAKVNIIKAAAQGDIFLPDFNDRTISSVVQWMYFQKLWFKNALQLCEIHTLAEELDLRDLVDICFEKLSSATLASIQHATNLGFTLLMLVDGKLPTHSTRLSEDPDGYGTALDDVVPTVFKYVLQKRTISPPLQKLVVGAIADKGDTDLFNVLEPHIDPELAMKVLKAMFICKSQYQVGSVTQSQLRDISGSCADVTIKTELQSDERLNEQ